MIKLEIKSVHSGYHDLEIGIEGFKYNSFRFGPRNVKVESDHRKVVNSRFGVKKNVVNERSEISRHSLPKISNRSIPIGLLLGKEYLFISLLSLDHRWGMEEE